MALSTGMTMFALLLAAMYHVNAVELKVGIYNSIPDLNGDNLASYKTMIQDGYVTSSPGNTVNAVVNTSLYDPYGDLTKYLQQDGFDMLEIDTMSLQDLVSSNLIVPVEGIQSNIFPAAVQAVLISDRTYAYPTLLCGNFLIGLSPGTASNCDLKSSRTEYSLFYSTLSSCRINLLSTYRSYDRIFGGKMNDAYGYYLPDLYVDGYIDKHGAASAQQAIDLATHGIIDEEVCDHLKWYIEMCNNDEDTSINKCYQDFPGSYVESSSNVYNDITNQETMFYFGFSEKLAVILKDNPGLQAYAALSGPLGDTNRLLQYTDALIISKKAWEEASQAKQNAMIDFVNYFTSTSLRTDIAIGVDIGGRLRYLLQANTDVYLHPNIANDAVMTDLQWALETGVALPYKSPDEMASMETFLSQQCLPGTRRVSKRTKSVVNLKKVSLPSVKRHGQGTPGHIKKEL